MSAASTVREMGRTCNFEERLRRHRVNGVTGLHDDPLEMARHLTANVHALLLVIGAAFDDDGEPAIQTLRSGIVAQAFDGVARLAALANFYVDEADEQLERRCG